MPHRQSKDTPTIALLAWGNAIEDFLSMVNVPLERFCREFTGSWMFGCVEALKTAGVHTVIICFSSKLTRREEFTHGPTGATIAVLPVTRVYRIMCPHLQNPYGRTVAQMFHPMRRWRRLLYPFLWILQHVMLYLPTPALRLARELRRHGCTAILCQEYEFPRFDLCVLVGKLMRLPVFASFQGGNYHRVALERVTRPIAMKNCSGLIIGSQTEIDRVRERYGVPESRVARLYNPVDLSIWRLGDRQDARRQLDIPDDALVVGWHGRVSIEHKGLDLLVKSWCLIEEEFPQAHLLMIGDGAGSAQLKEMIVTQQLRRVVWKREFVQNQRQISSWLAAADVYAFPSRHEGFPVAPVEASACGLPVIAALVDGIGDIFPDGEQNGGIIVQRENVKQFADAIAKLLLDGDLRKRMSAAARRRAEEAFSLSSTGSRLRSILLGDSQGA